MNTLPNDVLGLILKYLPRDGTDSRINAILTCKRWMNVYLTKSLPPWEVFEINGDGTHYCGIIGVFDVNAETIQFEYFYKWYALANTNPPTTVGRFNFDEFGFGEYMLDQACSYYRYMEKAEQVKTVKLVIFLLNESIRRKQPIDVSSAVAAIMCDESTDLGRLIFVDYPEFPIRRKVLKKWCTILVYHRKYPKDTVQQENRMLLIAWIKNRPEMTKYRARGQDFFLLS